MKSKTTASIIIIIAATILVGTFFLEKKRATTSSDSLSAGISPTEKESGADKQMARWFESRGYPDPNNLNAKYAAAWQQFQQIKNNTLSRNAASGGANWTSIGPGANIGGRTLCIAIDPVNSNKLWVGTAGGGIWKSINGGSSWAPVVTNLPVLGVTSIIIHPTNTNIIYAGTGEVYRADTLGMGFNVWKARGSYGIGIIKSIDGGTTWSQVFTKQAAALFGIQMLRFDPINSNTIYACATDGLYRSENSGGSWTNILYKTYVSDVAINPANTKQIVAGVGNLSNSDKGIYRTTNGNNAQPSWSKITSGLPTSFNGFTRFDNAGSGTLVASIGRVDNYNDPELFLSSDFGVSWIAKNYSDHTAFQYWFAHDVAINPANNNQFLFGGVTFYLYNSSSRKSGRGYRSAINNVHSDIHDIEYDPTNSNIVYAATDGGLYKSINGGSSFTAINNGLTATQFYASFATHPTNPSVMMGGLQDNGVVRFDGVNWTPVFGGDGGPCVFSPNGNTVLASNDARNVRRSVTGAAGTFTTVMGGWAFVADDRTGFMAPVAISKTNPENMYSATDNIHISTNGGSTWTDINYSTANSYIEQQCKTAIALAVSPLDKDKLYVSTSPFAQNTNNDLIWVHGQPNFFKTNTPNITPYSSIKNTLPDRFVMDIAISATNDDSVYVVLGGFGTSHVYVTGNGGGSWASCGNGLPDIPFNAILIDPLNPSVLYAGCDLGVFVSTDNGATWGDFNNGFWDATPIADLQVTADHQLVAATHGKGVFTSNLYSGESLRAITTLTGYHEDGINKLQCVAQEERDIEKYELERSTNGRNFSRIASFRAVNGGNHQEYDYRDPVHPNTSTVYYYRTRLTNTRGISLYTRVVAVEVSMQQSVKVLNNPFTNQLNLEVATPTSSVLNIRVLHANGIVAASKTVPVSAGVNRVGIYDLQHLPPGIYLLETIMAGKRYVRKLVKQ
jgi:hypothetical protein